MHYAELFAGAGGMSIGLEAAGWTCVAHAEIEPHARAVLRKQWPDVPLYGDVTQLDGRQFKGITMLTGGSPCQDLSIAGKRAGMADGTRSSLFFEQMRIWRESEAPLVLWENVMGAFSSNGGQDFGAVLQSIVGGTVVVPADGWRNAGVASGPTGVAAWRALDLQHFGWDGHTTPQRRRRVFVLGVRAGALDPAEVLLVRDGLLGHLEKGGEAGEGLAPDAGASVASTLRGFGHGWQGQHNSTHAIVAPNAGAGVAGKGGNIVYPSLRSGNVYNNSDPQMEASMLILQTAPATGASAAVAYTVTQYAQYAEGVGTLRANGGDLGGGSESLVLTYDARGNGEGAIANTLSGDHQNRVTDYTALVLRNREGKPGGGKGPLVSAERSLTLGTSNDQVVFRQNASGDVSVGSVANALATNGNASGRATQMVNIGIPRRLMPVECERLMGWPSGWTERGIDEQGREYTLSDTARYKLCGNGIGSPVAAWIGLQLSRVLDKKATKRYSTCTPSTRRHDVPTD
jgi:DNA (cytosine-5)-methyltransferase 1